MAGTFGVCKIQPYITQYTCLIRSGFYYPYISETCPYPYAAVSGILKATLVNPIKLSVAQPYLETPAFLLSYCIYFQNFNFRHGHDLEPFRASLQACDGLCIPCFGSGLGKTPFTCGFESCG